MQLNAAILLAIAATFGLLGYGVYMAAPVAVIASVIAAHHPPGRAAEARAAGTYWKQYLLLVPMMLGVFIAAWALGWLIGRGTGLLA